MRRRHLAASGVLFLLVGLVYAASFAGHALTPARGVFLAALFASAACSFLAGVVLDGPETVRRVAAAKFALDGVVLVGLLRVGVDAGSFLPRPLPVALGVLGGLVMVGVGWTVLTGDVLDAV